MSRSILGLADATARPNLHFTIIDPSTGWKFNPPSNTGWRYSRQVVSDKIEKGLIIFPKKENGRPRERIYAERMDGKTINFPSVIDDIFTADGTREIRDIFGEAVFPFPKPSELVLRLISQITNSDDIIMDSFAGSGTTGDAVLNLNHKEQSNRRFILIEMMPETAENITAVRLARVVKGYSKAGDTSKPIEGLGGGFRYCRLGVPLFNEFGDIDGNVSFSDLAAHVFFAETGAPIPSRASGITSYLGKQGEKAVYLLFAAGQEGNPREALGKLA